MDAVHLHLMFNHLPIVGVPLVLALLMWGLLRRSRDVMRTALGAAVIVAAVTYPVFLTGEPAEEQVEHARWMDERLVHEHEERAEAALIALLVTGGLAVFALWLSRGDRPVSTGLAGISAAGLALSAGLLGWAALAGGVIRHDELRASAATMAPSPGEAGATDSSGAPHDDDDDE